MSNSEKIARILWKNKRKELENMISGLVYIEIDLKHWDDLLPTDKNVFLTQADEICEVVGITKDDLLDRFWTRIQCK